MKILHLKTPLAAWLMLVTTVPLFFPSCVEYPKDTWIVKVTDMKSDSEEEWKLAYDYKGRLIQYGNTPIRYEEKSIFAGHMEWDYKKEKQYSTAYYFSEGKVCRSESYCLVEWDSIGTEVHKEGDYRWKEDSLFVTFRYQRLKDSLLLRRLEACYVYDRQHRLAEIIRKCYDGEDVQEWTCHSFLDYNLPINYTANLNLCAYIADREELDSFLFFLLGMDRGADARVLPNRIRHCVNQGDKTYIADGLYRLDGEKLVRMELISDRSELKERIDFQYYKGSESD